MPRGDGPFQVIKKINDNAYELDMPDTYLGSHSFNISYLTPFSVGFQNSSTNSLSPGEHDVDQGEWTPEGQDKQTQAQSEAQAQPMITPSIMPQRITRSKAQALGDEHQLMSLFVISLE